MNGSLRVGSIAGIAFEIHYTWFVVLVVFSWILADGFLPSRYGDWAATTYWSIGPLCAILLFASVVVHELAHSLVAKARGLPVEGITLFLFGGVSSLKADSRGPKDELIISAVGPLASLGLFAVLRVLYEGVTDTTTPFAALLWYLWWINLALAIFNMLPAFPMDGGRVLRSAIWALTGRVGLATRFATRSGQVVSVLIIAGGTYEALTGFFVSGLWTVLIGWFLFSAATRSRQDIDLEFISGGPLVSDLMEPDPPTVPADLPVADVLLGGLVQSGVSGLLVSEYGRVVGMVTPSDLRRLPRAEWDRIRVREVMTRTPVHSVQADARLPEALALLREHSIEQMPVMDGDRVVGLVRRSDLIGYLAEHE